MTEKKLIKSINYDEQELISDILVLHNNNNDLDCDLTYSKGNFYNKGIVKPPKYKFDLYPQTKDTIQAESQQLPIKNNTLNSIMFDPIFLSTSGPSLKIDNKSNHINKRFPPFRTEKLLFQYYIDTLHECYRILKDDGILIFKIQDKVSSSIQYFSHVFIINEATKAGFYCKDLFILLAKNRIVADWQLQNQKNARKFHSYFVVFKKCNKVVKYI